MAARYFVNGGVDQNWGTSGNWAATSGGAGGAGVPTNSDDVFFDANSPGCTVNTSARVCKSIDFTGYTNTLTMSNIITVSGDIVLQAAQSSRIAGSAALKMNASGTITSNGGTWPNPFTFIGSLTATLSGDFTVNGLLASGETSTSPVVTLNGDTLICNGGLSMQHKITGTADILAQNGIFNANTTIATIAIPFTVQATGTVTLQTLAFLGTTFVYTSGTVVSTAFNLVCSGSCSLDFNGISALTATFNSSSTITLVSDLNVRTSVVTGNPVTINGAFEVNCGGFQYGVAGGSATLVLRGGNTVGGITYTAGTLEGSTSSQTCFLNIEIIGDITLGTHNRFFGNTIVFTSGNINPGTGTLRVGPVSGSPTGTTVFDLSADFLCYNFEVVQGSLSGTSTIEIHASNLIVTNQFTINIPASPNHDVIFSGDGGWVAHHFICNAGASRTITLNAGSNYTVENSLTLGGTNAAPLNFYNSDGSAPYTDYAIFTLLNGADQRVLFVRARGIDSSQGQTIWDVVGTISSPLTDTLNWNEGTRPAPFGFFSS
jgi:hypothetical protein